MPQSVPQNSCSQLQHKAAHQPPPQSHRSHQLAAPWPSHQQAQPISPPHTSPQQSDEEDEEEDEEENGENGLENNQEEEGPGQK